MESNQEQLRPSGVVMTLPDPKSKKVCIDGQQGGTFQWRTETHEHSSFEIRFRGSNPVDDTPNQSFNGDDLNPVVIRLKRLGYYEYEICQTDAKGHATTSGPHTFSVHVCHGCYP